jgi:hypothetical protein
MGHVTHSVCGAWASTQVPGDGSLSAPLRRLLVSPRHSQPVHKYAATHGEAGLPRDFARFGIRIDSNPNKMDAKSSRTQQQPESLRSQKSLNQGRLVIASSLPGPSRPSFVPKKDGRILSSPAVLCWQTCSHAGQREETAQDQ